MSEEIDISKLHGVIKEMALACDRDGKISKGHGKLNTQYELALFKDMVIRAGKQKELKKQLPNIKGIIVPEVGKSDKTKDAKEKDLNNRIIDLMKDKVSDEMKNVVSEKLALKKDEKNI